ncbi:unnamed protein product [Lampetra fluviatilis]
MGTVGFSTKLNPRNNNKDKTRTGAGLGRRRDPEHPKADSPPAPSRGKERATQDAFPPARRSRERAGRFLAVAFSSRGGCV